MGCFREGSLDIRERAPIMSSGEKIRFCVVLALIVLAALACTSAVIGFGKLLVYHAVVQEGPAQTSRMHEFVRQNATATVKQLILINTPRTPSWHNMIILEGDTTKERCRVEQKIHQLEAVEDEVPSEPVVVPGDKVALLWEGERLQMMLPDKTAKKDEKE